MNLGLMVKRVELVNGNLVKYKGDAVTNIVFSDMGVIFSWGDSDRFEVSFEDFNTLQDIVRSMVNKIEKERYLKGQNSGSTLAPVPSRY